MRQNLSYRPDGQLWLYGVGQPVNASSMQFDYDYFQSGVDDLVERDLAKLTPDGFSSTFGGWLKQVNGGVDKRQLVKNAEVWETILSSQLVRQALFTPSLIKFLYRDDDDLIADDGFHYPVLVCLLLALKSSDSKILTHLKDAKLLSAFFPMGWPKKLNVDWVTLTQARLDEAISQDSREWERLQPIIAETEFAKNYDSWSVKLMEMTLEKLKYLTPQGVGSLMKRSVGKFFGKFGGGVKDASK